MSAKFTESFPQPATKDKENKRIKGTANVRKNVNKCYVYEWYYSSETSGTPK